MQTFLLVSIGWISYKFLLSVTLFHHFIYTSSLIITICGGVCGSGRFICLSGYPYNKWIILAKSLPLSLRLTYKESGIFQFLLL